MNANKYNSIAEAKARIEEINQVIRSLIEEAQQIQHNIITMNDCDYQNSCVNQPEQYS